MDMPVNVPVDDPNADTEWNDILRKHGVIPEKPPSPTPMIEEALTEARRLAHENRLEGKDLEELDELEDEEDEDFLDSYRQKRMQELSTIQNASVYNQVYPLAKPDWTKEVTDASHKAFIFVLLTASNTPSRLLEGVWRDLARKWGDVKFCQMRGDLCIEGYPERNCPTVLVYKDGDVRKTVVGLGELGEEKVGVSNIEGVMIELGVVKREDARLKRKGEGDSGEVGDGERRGLRQGGVGRGLGDDEDSDWD
ncbi:Proteolipid protein 2 [Saxophila tyrrhenica]|uniref:Proteolipid protein 2 n=1 Tax=Saxophila tyrrhenica TaxID=1690608 RepID=A0AAV9NXG4_9PEZI|nr:Proteolipid protein 2 [Saxophila tyrrhenica]